MTVVIVSTRSKQQALAQLDQTGNSVTNVSQQGWSLQDALWIDCQNQLEVTRFYQPFETASTTTPTDQTTEQIEGEKNPLEESESQNPAAETSLVTEEARQ
jgi:hypothetical protein